MREKFEETVTRYSDEAKRLRHEAARWRRAALTARCGLEVKAGTFTFDRGMVSIMSKALEENAAKFDERADEVMAKLRAALPVGGENDGG